LSSIAAPLEIYEYSIENDSLSRIVQQEMDGFDSQEYRSHPLQLDSEQGALVSMNLLFKDTALPKEPKPLVLVPYSSDQELVENSFAIDRLSLLDRGVLYANCKVRGSVENSDWLLSGVENNQLDTVSDLKACIQQLFHMRITTPKMLSLLASGDSAMAVGSIMNSHPDWFQAVVLMNTVMDPLSQLELSSISTQQLEFVLSYSPYSTIKKQPYPAILFLDENTNHSPNLPWIAMMRTNRDIRLYYQTVESSNHNAISYAFLLSQLGVAVLP
jgi:oligopeptidase B